MREEGEEGGGGRREEWGEGRYLGKKESKVYFEVEIELVMNFLRLATSSPMTNVRTPPPSVSILRPLHTIIQTLVEGEGKGVEGGKGEE